MNFTLPKHPLLDAFMEEKDGGKKRELMQVFSDAIYETHPERSEVIALRCRLLAEDVSDKDAQRVARQLRTLRAKHPWIWPMTETRYGVISDYVDVSYQNLEPWLLRDEPITRVFLSGGVAPEPVPHRPTHALRAVNFTRVKEVRGIMSYNELMFVMEKARTDNCQIPYVTIDAAKVLLEAEERRFLRGIVLKIVGRDKYTELRGRVRHIQVGAVQYKPEPEVLEAYRRLGFETVNGVSCATDSTEASVVEGVHDSEHVQGEARNSSCVR